MTKVFIGISLGISFIVGVLALASGDTVLAVGSAVGITLSAIGWLLLRGETKQ